MTWRDERLRGGTLAAMVNRDFKITSSYRTAFLFDLAFGVLNLLVFYFISRTLQPRGDDLTGAATYFDFAAVGIALTLVIQATTTQLAARIHQEQLTGTLEALWSQPVASTELALGLAGFPFVFATARAALYVLIAGAFLDMNLHDADWVGFLLVLAMSGIAIGAIGILVGAVVFALKRGEGIAALFTFALGLLGGALFPVSAFPDWVRSITAVVPTRFAFDGARAALFDGGGWGGSFAALTLFVAVAVPASLLVFRAALRHSLRTGSLGQY